MTLWDLLPRKVPKHKVSHVKHGAICGERETTHLTPKREAGSSNLPGDAKIPCNKPLLSGLLHFTPCISRLCLHHRREIFLCKAV